MLTYYNTEANLRLKVFQKLTKKLYNIIIHGIANTSTEILYIEIK